MVALVYAKHLSEDPRSTVVPKSQVIAHSVKDPADFTIVGISADIKRVPGELSMGKGGTARALVCDGNRHRGSQAG